MNPERMTARGVAFESFEYGHLHHYRLRSNKMSQKYRTLAFVNIEPCFEDSVFGVLYKLPSTVNLEDLDKKEGYPFHYEKCFVPVYTKEGMKLALVYVATRNWASENDLPMPSEYKTLMNSGLDKCEDLVIEDKQLYEAFLHYKERAQEMTMI